MRDLNEPKTPLQLWRQPQSPAPAPIGGWASTEPDNDAELIAICDRLVHLRTYEIEMIRLLDDDAETDDALAETDVEWKALADRVRQIDRPMTLEGARAMARCVVRHCGVCPDGGDIVGVDLSDWMAIRVSEFLAGSAVE